MSRYAIIDGDAVINVVEWDGKTPYDPNGELVELAEGEPVGPGWSRIGGEWVPPQDDDAAGE